jgi:hypothetical protein
LSEMVIYQLQDLGILLKFIEAKCTFLEDGMAPILWMNFIRTRSYPIIGTKNVS